MRKTFLVILLAAFAVVLCTACGREEGDASIEADSTRTFEVVVIGFESGWKIRGIKAIREVTGLGLADAKGLIENTPSAVKGGLSQTQAEETKAFLEASRLSVEIRTK